MIREILSAKDKGRAEALDELRGLGFDNPAACLANFEILAGGPLGPHLELIAASSLKSPSPSGALNNLERLLTLLDDGSSSRLAGSAAALERLITVSGSSPYLAGILLQRPEWFAPAFLDGGLERARADAAEFAAALAGLASGARDQEAFSAALRVFRKGEFLRIGSRDLLGMADVVATTRELSDLASASLDAAVRFATSELERSCGKAVYTDYDGVEREAAFAVIGLGKLGGRELNFSSDIDILYVYSSDAGQTTGVEGDEGSRISLHAFFVKLSTMVTRLISSVTDEGFVFRVDLDLRPEGPSGAMANSLHAMENYYATWGQTWERAAMIKARTVAGDQALGEEFAAMIRPFVFRKYLDFTAIEEIKTMKEKINLSLLRRRSDAVDVKLGRGGIREIEFICQAHQLIHGGRDEDIRERNTLKAMERLAEGGYLSASDARALDGSYRFLRNLEHRIQIVEGRQTQAVPARPGELERLSRMMGLAAGDGRTSAQAFWDEYRLKTDAVHNCFRSIFYGAEEAEEAKEVDPNILMLLAAEAEGAEGTERLAALGFKDPEGAMKNLSSLRGGPDYLKLGARSRVLLEKLAPALLAEAARSPDPDMALKHLDAFLSAVGARTVLYSLLYENPRVAGELVKLFGTSVFLSRTLIERPESLDIFLARELSTPYRPREEILAEFTEAVRDGGGGGDYEENLDELRRLRNQEVFRIGMNDIQGMLTPHQVSAQMTFLAEAAVEAARVLAADELAPRFGYPPEGASFSVLGLGKLGGRELIYGSDLDIIFVYEDAGEADGVTDGARSISTHEYYVKLCQRIISILSVRTREGIVFNVDTRLRPSGGAGPLVVSSSAFLNYHSGRTQVWERQAMTRTRAVAGDIPFGTRVVEEAGEIIYSKPLTGEDVAEMLRIRKRMEMEIAKEDPTRYNIKTGRGGIVDIEFLVQTLQLRWGLEKRSVRTPHTLKALTRLKREKVVSDDDYRVLRDAYAFMRLLEMRLRIVHDRPEGYLKKGSEELTTLARGLGYRGAEGAEELVKDYARYAEEVRERYMRTMEGL